MAGDWIKMRTDLASSPKVVRIASALKADRFRTVGGLHSAWSLFDTHSADGLLAGYTPQILDDLIGWPGFSDAMIAVDWLIFDGESLALPRFDDHNGKSAKRRAQDKDRKGVSRTDGKSSASDADKKRTREEKRREEEKNPPKPPTGGAAGDGEQKPKRAAKMGFAEFRAACREAGEKPIPEGDAVFAYAERIGLPAQFIGLAWRWFKARYADKQQGGVRGWRQTFRNAVESNWPKLWFQADDGSWQLTTAGKQAKVDAEADAAGDAQAPGESA